MARYRASIDTDWAPEELFAYISDFSNAEEWDPGVARAERVAGRPAGLGTEFRLVAEFLGRHNELTYRTVEYEAPRSVAFAAENASAVPRDRITLSPGPRGTRLAYEADLRLKGPLRLAGPLLALAFRRVGDRARDGLRDVLGRPRPLTQHSAA